MNNPTIVIITPYYAPAWSYGGPPRVLSSLAEELVRQGCQVRVITTDSLGDTRTDTLHEILNGVEIFRFRSLSNWLCYHQKLFFIPGLQNQAKHILKSADIVLFSDVRSGLSWQLFSYVSRILKPYGVFLFGQVERDKGLKAFLKYILDVVWVRRYIREARWLFAQTPHESSVAVSVLGAKTSQVRLSLLPVLTQNSKQISKHKRDSHIFRQKYGIKNIDTLLLFVGRIHHLKGVDILIKSTLSLLVKNSQLRLCIVGRDDGALAQLHGIVPVDMKQRIIFTGPLYAEDAQMAYRAADIFVFTPRFYEETSTAALEALAHGVPVVTTQEADIPFLEEYQAGYVVPNTELMIQQAIQKILALSPDQLQQKKRKARRLISEKYASSKVARQLLKDVSELTLQK